MLARKAAFIGIFASLHIILYLMPFELWRNWAIYLEPIEGIVLGPWAGFTSAFIGSVVARIIKPTDFWMFGITAEPIGALTAGLLAKGNWRSVIAIYGVMLSAYFIHPLGRELPLWAIIDIFIALVLIYPVAKIGRRIYNENSKHLTVPLALTSFISTATDSLVRIFLFIPAGLFSFFGLTTEAVYAIFIAGAISSYIEDILVVIVSLIVGIPILLSMKKIQGFKIPLS